MIVTNRDKQVLRFVEDYKIATTSTLTELFYGSLRVAQTRLKLLYENKYLKRDRDHFTSEFYYYLKKPKQLRHSLLVTDFYRELNKLAVIEYFKNEFVIEDIRADAFIAYEYRGKKDIAFLEVEISNKGFDIEKYEILNRSNKLRKYGFPRFPTIFAVTDKPIPKTNLKIIKINEKINLKDF